MTPVFEIERRSMNKYTAIACSLILGAAGTASATIVTAEFLGPTNGQIGLGGPNNNAGQTFTPTIGGAFDSLDLFLRLNGATPVTLTVSLWNVGGDGLPTGTPIAEAAIATSLTETFEWYTFDFSASGVVFDAGVQYAFTTRSESGDGGYLLATSTGNNYTDGRGIVSFGETAPYQFMGSNFIVGERDALFVARVIPAPGAAGLLACGMLVSARRRRTCA